LLNENFTNYFSISTRANKAAISSFYIRLCGFYWIDLDEIIRIQQTFAKLGNANLGEKYSFLFGNQGFQERTSDKQKFYFDAQPPKLHRYFYCGSFYSGINGW